MTVHPIDTEALRRLADAATDGPWEAIGTGVRGGDHWYVCADHEAIVSVSAQDGSNEDQRQPLAEFIAAAREAVPALLDALAAAEHRATRAEAQSAIRGRAVAIHRERGRVAEAERDQAYEWADGQSYPLVMRQGEILTGVANALNGPTPPLTSWSHHDLAEKAAAMVARAERAEARIKAVRELHRPVDVEPSDTICAACSTLRGSGESLRYFPTEEWPCATIRALEG